MKYIWCNVDDEHYTSASMEVFPSLLRARLRILQFYFEDGYNKFANKEKFMPVYRNEKLISYRQDFNWQDDWCGDKYEVNEILPVDPKKGKVVLVHYHCYEGVDFRIVGQFSTWEEAQEKRKSIMNDFYPVYEWDGDYDSVIDDGIEWLGWRIVEI